MLWSFASDGSLHADLAAGRSLMVLYQATCVCGWIMYWTNFHAASRCWPFLKTASSAPPTKDVELWSFGARAVAHLPSSCGADFDSWLMVHGPEKNIGVSPPEKDCTM